MQLTVIYSLFGFLLNVVIDYGSYVLVDQMTQNTLIKIHDLSERRDVWLFETAVLCVVCVLIYSLHHFPYLLTLMTILTFVYTQLMGRINFRRLWMLLWTRWDEFEQHEQSMEKLNGMRTSTVVTQNVQSGVAQNPPPSTANPGVPNVWFNTAMEQYHQQQQMMQQHQQQQQQQHYNSTPAAQQQQQHTPNNWEQDLQLSSTSTGGGTPGMSPSRVMLNPVAMSTPTSSDFPRGNNKMPANNMEALSPIAYCRVPDYMMNNNMKRTPTLSQRRGGPSLARPGIHSYMNKSNNNDRSPNNQSPNSENLQSLSLKARLMSAIGMNPFSSTPPGLVNAGQNICFLNSILQCLAYTPSLLDCLRHDLDPSKDTATKNSTQKVDLLGSLIDTLQTLSTKPGSSDVTVLDPVNLRTILSALPGSVIQHPESCKATQNKEGVPSAQHQQDCSEILMWLLDQLHQLLNRAPDKKNLQQTQAPMSGIEPFLQAQRHPGSPVYTSMTLNMLRFIYSDLTPQRIADLKAACRGEIENANGVECESYAEPIQRLSDLEWLTYKEDNNSAVDDLFTGQLVETQHCISCSRITASIQTFTILPVPVAQPNNFNGLVYLQDCFTHYGQIEDMIGANGLQCSCSNNKQTVVPNGNAQHRLCSTADSALTDCSRNNTNVSPVTVGHNMFFDSGFQDHNMLRTANVTSRAAYDNRVCFTDGQRRSLLRQLPECLVVQLMRFSVQNGTARKIQRPVKVPVTELDLTRLIVDNVMKREDLTALNASYHYDLYAMCLHVGSDSIAHGHYISYVKSSETGRWYKCDDETVTDVNIEYEMNTRLVRENVYLLFYHKNRNTGYM